MNYGRFILNLGFWITYSVIFDVISGTLFPDLSLDMQIYLWFFGLCTGTFIFNFLWVLVQNPKVKSLPGVVNFRISYQYPFSPNSPVTGFGDLPLQDTRHRRDLRLPPDKPINIIRGICSS